MPLGQVDFHCHGTLNLNIFVFSIAGIKSTAQLMVP